MASNPNPTSLRDALAAATETRGLEIGSGALEQVPRVFREQFGDLAAVVVADKNTMAAAGEAVLAQLSSSGIKSGEPFIFADPKLYAEHTFVEQLEARLKMDAAIPIVVGSGTLNDLAKLAAHRSARSYLCVATAASMDGYTAFGASITHNGSKQTFFCPAPKAVVADLDVICAAPPEMNAWGYADLLAKVTAGADWLVADALGAEPIHEQAWNIAQGRLRELVADPAGIERNDPAALSRLVEGLMLGGFAMQAAKSSRAASGAEHQFSHLWDMQHHTYHGKAPSHGFKVGIGTLAVTALYGYLLRQPLETCDIERACQAWPDEGSREARIRELFDDRGLATVALQETRAKSISATDLRKQLEHLRSIWPGLRERLRVQLLPFTQLKLMLAAAGAPVEPEQIGIPRERLRRSFEQAWFIRRRFTVLDLVVRLGLLESALDQIFGPSGHWPLRATRALSPTRG